MNQTVVKKEKEEGSAEVREKKEISKGRYQKSDYRLRPKKQLRLPSKEKICKESGCGIKVYAKELCRSHYIKERKRLNNSKTDKLTAQKKFVSKIMNDLDKMTERNENYFDIN